MEVHIPYMKQTNVRFFLNHPPHHQTTVYPNKCLRKNFFYIFFVVFGGGGVLFFFCSFLSCSCSCYLLPIKPTNRIKTIIYAIIKSIVKPPFLFFNILLCNYCKNNCLVFPIRCKCLHCLFFLISR